MNIPTKHAVECYTHHQLFNLRAVHRTIRINYFVECQVHLRTITFYTKFVRLICYNKKLTFNTFRSESLPTRSLAKQIRTFQKSPRYLTQTSLQKKLSSKATRSSVTLRGKHPMLILTICGLMFTDITKYTLYFPLQATVI